MIVEQATSLGDGWLERQYVKDHITTTETRNKFVFTGGPAARAMIGNLRGAAVPST